MSWNPQVLAARGVEGYLILVRTFHRLVTSRRSAALGLLADLAVLRWRASRRTPD